MKITRSQIRDSVYAALAADSDEATIDGMLSSWITSAVGEIHSSRGSHGLLETLATLGVGLEGLEESVKAASEAVAYLEGPIRIALLGELNAGKSSLVNALLGRDIARCGVTPTTIEPQAYLLTDGVALLDMPGWNTRHQDIRRIPLFEGAVWVFSALQAGKRTEIEMIEELLRRGIHVGALLNKTDLLTSEEVSSLIAHVQAQLPPDVAWLGETTANTPSTSSSTGETRAARAPGALFVRLTGPFMSSLTRARIALSDWTLGRAIDSAEDALSTQRGGVAPASPTPPSLPPVALLLSRYYAICDRVFESSSYPPAPQPKTVASEVERATWVKASASWLKKLGRSVPSAEERRDLALQLSGKLESSLEESIAESEASCVRWALNCVDTLSRPLGVCSEEAGCLTLLDGINGWAERRDEAREDHLKRPLRSYILGVAAGGHLDELLGAADDVSGQVDNCAQWTFPRIWSGLFTPEILLQECIVSWKRAAAREMSQFSQQLRRTMLLAELPRTITLRFLQACQAI